jgi:serine beta-lactamase-like protein LACTB, mitochondrial
VFDHPSSFREETVNARSTSLALTWALVLSTAAATRSAAAAPRCEAPADSLRHAVRTVHEKQRNVGLAALMTRDGERVFSLDLGLADLEQNVQVDTQTRFGIASVTKLFTAVALLDLVASGKIDLDAPVQTYVPSFPVKPQGTITVRMLATHRSGIPHPQKRTPEFFATHYETATAALVVFANDSLVAVPGSERVYSSSNYNLLAAMIESVTGKTFQEVVKQEIFLPLKLANTSFDDVLRPLPHRARRYSFYHPWTYAESSELYVVPTWDYSFNLGGGNIVTTASDLATFGAALSRPGFLTAEQLDLLYDEEWFGASDDRGRRYLMATGANPGLQAGLAVYRDLGVVAVVLSNTWGIGSRSAEMVNLAPKLAGMCLGDGVVSR